MNEIHSITFGLLYNANVITFWNKHNKVRSIEGTVKGNWEPLDFYNYEDFVGSKQRFQFKTTVICTDEDREGEELEPWQQFNNEDETEERPCTWTINMEFVPWVRTIYRVEGEILP